MATLNKDVHLTAEFVTFLRAGFYGQILFEGALSRLESTLVPSTYLDTAHRAFDKIDVWINDLASELPIFSQGWESPETFDAIAAMSFMRDLKKDIVWLIPQVEVALRAQNLSQNREAVKLLVASLIRSASTRCSYVETLHSIFTKLKAQNLAQQVEFEIAGAKEYVQVTQVILDTFAATGVYDLDVCDKLRKEASLTPADFRAHMHDANILLNVYAKEFTYELAEIPREEADLWIAHKIPAVAAGYWRSYGFSPEEFLEWRRLGVNGAPLAANWRRANFSPEVAITWIKEGIPPVIATQWRSSGLEPPRVAALLKRGITDPAKAPRSNVGDVDQDSDEVSDDYNE